MTDLVQKLVGALEECQRWHNCDKWRDGSPSQRAAWKEHRDMIEAALSEAKAGGWVAVPVEPTEEMLDAAFAYETQAGVIQGGDVVDAYKAMLAARPSPIRRRSNQPGGLARLMTERSHSRP